MKYKIILPFSLDGSRYGLNFYKGEAVTDNKALAGRLKLRGVRVEEVEDDYTIKSIKGIALGEKKSPGNAVPLTNSDDDIDYDDVDSDVDSDGESDDINSDDEGGSDDDFTNDNNDITDDDIDEAELKDISDMNTKELKQFALDNGIDLTGIPNKKTDILNAIKEVIDKRGE